MEDAEKKHAQAIQELIRQKNENEAILKADIRQIELNKAEVERNLTDNLNKLQKELNDEKWYRGEEKAQYDKLFAEAEQMKVDIKNKDSEINNLSDIRATLRSQQKTLQSQKADLTNRLQEEQKNLLETRNKLKEEELTPNEKDIIKGLDALFNIAFYSATDEDILKQTEQELQKYETLQLRANPHLKNTHFETGEVIKSFVAKVRENYQLSENIKNLEKQLKDTQQESQQSEQNLKRVISDLEQKIRDEQQVSSQERTGFMTTIQIGRAHV